MIARHGTAAHIEKLVRMDCSIDRLHEAARANRQHAQRALHWRYDDDGSMLITVRLPAEQGALVLKAITAAADFARAERDGADREPIQAQGRLRGNVGSPPPTASTTPNRPLPRAAPMRCATWREQFLAREAVKLTPGRALPGGHTRRRADAGRRRQRPTLPHRARRRARAGDGATTRLRCVRRDAMRRPARRTPRSISAVAHAAFRGPHAVHWSSVTRAAAFRAA